MRRKTISTEPIMAVVGIDLSITLPGICVGCKSAEYHCRAIKTASPKYYAHPTLRYDAISEALISGMLCFTGPGWRPIVVIEDYAFGGMGKTFALAENGGILKYKLIRELGVRPEDIYLVSTAHLKMFVTGKGSGAKSIIIKEVYKRWKFDTDDDNEADAFALWKIGMCLAGLDTPDRKSVKALSRIKEYNNADKK